MFFIRHKIKNIERRLKRIMKVYLGTDKNDELVYLEWDKAENKQKKCFSLCGGSYREPITESEGEQRAKEYLDDGEGWRIAVEAETTTASLQDWKEEVLSINGWEHVVGDVEDFGEYEGETIYLQNSSGGQHKEEIKNFKNLWIEEKDLKEVYKLWDTQHLKPIKKESVLTMERFFEKYKKFCSDQEALNQYLENIEY